MLPPYPRNMLPNLPKIPPSPNIILLPTHINLCHCTPIFLFHSNPKKMFTTTKAIFLLPYPSKKFCHSIQKYFPMPLFQEIFAIHLSNFFEFTPLKKLAYAPSCHFLHQKSMDVLGSVSIFMCDLSALKFTYAKVPKIH